MNQIIRPGFTYTMAARDKRTNQLIATEHAKNRVPTEGLNDMVTAYFKGGAGPANLYIGLWSGAHIPNGTETAATLSSLVTEVTDYVQAGRMLLELGGVTAGAASNAADPARFDMLASATVNGAFISTVQAKGATTGKLLSVVRFANPRPVDASVYLEVLTGFQFVSL